MSARRWSLCLVVMLTLLLGMVTVAQAANQIVIVKSEYTQKYYTKIGGSFSAYWSSVEKIMQRAGYEGKYDTLTDADVEDGKLSADTWKLAILPVNNCMSKKEAEQIIKYVKAGGALIANYNVGMRFENSNDAVNFLLADVTGVDRAPEFASGVNPNYANMQATDAYHPFFAGLPKTIPFLKHYTVLGMPRPEVKTLARWYSDAGVQSNVERKSGAIYQIGRVVYNGGDIWDPDKSLDTPELNMLIKNMIDELLSGRVAMALPPSRKRDDGFYIKGRYAVRTFIGNEKVTSGEPGNTTVPYTGDSAWTLYDQDGYRNSELMLAPQYVKGNVEAGAEVWTRIHVDRPQYAESQETYPVLTGGIGNYGVYSVSIPTIMTAWTKVNTKELLFTAAYQPDRGFDPIGDLKMVGSSDPLGLVSPNALNNTNWTSNAKMQIKNFKGWTGLVGLGITQPGYPAFSTQWTDNAYLYLREDTLKFGKNRLEVGLTYDLRRLDVWNNFLGDTQVLSPDLKLKTPYGNIVLQSANSDQRWIYQTATPPNTYGTSFRYPIGNATLFGIERVPVGGLKVSTQYRTMSNDFRDYALVGMMDLDYGDAYWKAVKYDGTAWINNATANDPTAKRTNIDNRLVFNSASQSLAEEAIDTWYKNLGKRVQKTNVSGDLIKGVLAVNYDNETVKKLDAMDQTFFTSHKLDLQGKKALGIFTPRFTFEREDGTEYRWGYNDEPLTWTKLVTTGGVTSTVVTTDTNDHIAPYPVNNSVMKLETAYQAAPAVSGVLRYTKTSINEHREADRDVNPFQAEVYIDKVPYRNVVEESGTLHGDVKVVLSPNTNVTTGIDLYNADQRSSTDDATLKPGHSVSVLTKVGHNFSDKMWGNLAEESYYFEGDEAGKTSVYADLSRQITKNINSKFAYYVDGIGKQNILYGQLGYSLPVSSTTGLYLKWRRTTPHATGVTSDSLYLSMTHIVGNAQLTASYGKVPFDTSYTDYGHPWDWMAGGTVRSADTAMIDYKITF